MSRIDSHIAQVQRQLILDRFIDFLARSFFVLGILALVVVMMDKFIHFGLPAVSLWVGLGMVVIATIVLTVMNRPSRQAAAVAIDEKLGLKEKFSTALSVRRLSDPFAQAVVRDAEQTAASVRLAGQFPVTFPRVGIYALLLGAIAFSAYRWFPELDIFKRKQAAQAAAQKAQEAEQAKKIATDALIQLNSLPLSMKETPEVKLAKRHLEDLVKQPMATREATARRVAEALADAQKGMESSLQKNKEYAQQQAAEKMLKSMAGKPIDGTGPVAEAQRKLVNGDFEEAVKDVEKAIKDFEKESPKKKEEMAAQMQQLAQQLNQVAQDPAAQQQMQKQLQQLGANQQQIQQAQQMVQKAAQGDKQAQQQLQQAMQQMAQGMNQQQQQQLAQAMQNAMQNANAQANAQQMAQAAQQMAQAMAQAAQQQGNQGNQNNQQNQQNMQQAAQQLQQQLQQMQAAQQDAKQMQQAQQQMQQAMQQAAGQCQGGNCPPGQGPGEANKAVDGQAGNWKPGQGNPQQGNGPGGGDGQAWGDRSGKTASPFGTKAETDAGHYNEKGKHLASIYVKDKSVKGEAKLELQKAIEAAEADSADDIDDSRVDRRTQEAVKRYFEVMKKEAAAAPEKK